LGLGGSYGLLEAIEKARLFLFFTRSEEAQRHRMGFYLEAPRRGKRKARTEEKWTNSQSWVAAP
jgi:hypothetical protein